MNKKLIIGIAAGVAVAATAGILIARKKKSQKTGLLEDRADDLSDSFSSKLRNLRKKASREFRQVIERGEDIANIAKDRTSELAQKTSMGLH